MRSRSSASDPLAAVLTLLHPRAVFSKTITGSGRWSVRYAPHEDAGFAVVLAGSCSLRVVGYGELQVAEGDFVFLPPSSGFTMASDPSLSPTLVAPTSRDVRHGAPTGPASLRMLGGYFELDRANDELLARFLPALVHVRGDAPGAARLRALVALIRDEASTHRPARESILHRLVEVVLVEALRVQPTAATRREGGLLAGLADPALSRALRRVHGDVARRWTVADLARAAGMSRAAFAERFARTVGMPPMQYVLEWRVAIAKDLLRSERRPLTEIAEAIGYQSASAFSTAFTRHVGQPPSAFARDE